MRPVGPGGHEIARRGQLGRHDRQTAGVKIAYYSPLPRRDRGSRITRRSSARAPAANGRRRRPARTVPSDSEGRHRPLSRRQRSRASTAGSSRRYGGGPSGRPCTSSSCTPRVRDHPRPGRRRGLLRGAGARRRARGPRARAGGPAGRIQPLWETRAQEFPLAHGVLDAATGLIVHSDYVEGLARDAGYDRRSGTCRCRPGPCRRSSGADRGRPVIGCFGHVNESKRIPQLSRAFARLRAGRAAAARRLLVAALRPIELRRVSIRRDYVPEDELWRCSPPATRSCRCAGRRWARHPPRRSGRSPSASL
jgi:hypothetical protein